MNLKQKLMNDFSPLPMMQLATEFCLAHGIMSPQKETDKSVSEGEGEQEQEN